MSEELPSIIGIVLGLIISIPIARHMFRECFGDYFQLKKEMTDALGSESQKLLDGKFTDAVNHQFSEAKAVFVLVFPVLVFLFIYFITSSIAATAIELIS